MKTTKVIVCIATMFAFIASLCSCSISFEKRRYRPGYHVDVVQRQHRSKTNRINTESVKINDMALEKISTPFNLSTAEYEQAEENPVIIKNKKIEPNRTELVKTKPIQEYKPTFIHAHKTSKKINKASETKKSKSLRDRKTAAWILGGISVLLAILVAILFSVYGLGFYGIMLIVYGVLGLAAILLAIIALIVRFAGIRKEEGYVHKPVGRGFTNAGFYISIITVCLAVFAFIFSLLFPGGFFSVILCLISAIMACLSFGMGFKSLKDDKSIKTKLTIIFGFIALLLAIISIILIIV